MRKPYLKNSHTEIREFVDAETKKTLKVEVKNNEYIAKTKEEFFMMYSHIEPAFYKFSKHAKDVFVYLCFSYRADRDFAISGYIRQAIGDKIGVSAGTVANVLTELKEAEALIQKAKGVYRINPYYAFKGGQNERKTAMLAVIRLGYKPYGDGKQIVDMPVNTDFLENNDDF